MGKPPRACAAQSTSPLARLGLGLAVVLPLVGLQIYERTRSSQLQEQLAEAERRLARYEALETRTGNPPFQQALEDLKQTRLKNETTQLFQDELFDTPSRRFPHGHDVSQWYEHIQRTTPTPMGAVGEEEDFRDDEQDAPGGPAFCYEMDQIVISQSELHPQPAGAPLSAETRKRAWRALTECGYVYLDNFFPAHKVHAFRKAYERFRKKPEAKAFEYPCQGPGRKEHSEC